MNKSLIQLFSVFSFLTFALSITAEAETSDDELIDAISNVRLSIEHKDGIFSGNGISWLLNKANNAQFFLVGEEHGIAENPLLMAQLFESLSDSGYQHFGIEVSPYMATHLDKTLKAGGLQALASSYDWGTEPAFFGMKEEAVMLERIRKASSASTVFWGFDYEVAGDKLLVEKLNSFTKPQKAQKALAKLAQESEQAWEKYLETRGPQYIFSFSADPMLVKEVMEVWPEAPAEAQSILNTLYETLSINRFWINGKGWQSNERRANLFRNNFLDYWRATPDKSVKVMVKLGAAHLMRGLNTNNVYDLGSVLPEVAAYNETSTFSLLVLPGQDSQIATLDPTQWVYRPAPAKDGYTKNLDEFYNHTLPSGYTLFDLAPLRNIVFSRAYKDKQSIRDLVMRFDAVLVMTGSTPSQQFFKR